MSLDIALIYIQICRGATHSFGAFDICFGYRYCACDREGGSSLDREGEPARVLVVLELSVGVELVLLFAKVVQNIGFVSRVRRRRRSRVGHGEARLARTRGLLAASGGCARPESLPQRFKKKRLAI